jgi:hypothetical protein
MNKRGLVLLLGLLIGCGKEIARIPMTGEAEGDASVTASAGQKLALWTQLDAEYDGAWSPSYAVELRDASGKAVASATCDPLTPTTRIKSVQVHVGAHHTISYSGKMQCELTAPSAGTFTVHAKLAYGAKPATLTVKDISLVVKI